MEGMPLSDTRVSRGAARGGETQEVSCVYATMSTMILLPVIETVQVQCALFRVPVIGVA